MGDIVKWTSEELLFLKENYKEHGAKYCSDKLNRTILAVRKRARMNGLSYKCNRIKYNVDTFTEAVLSSTSLSDILKKMNLRAAGGNFKTIKKYIKDLDIDISHFTTKEEYGKMLSGKNKKPIEFYLVESSINWSSHIKNRLYKEGLKERKCEKCGQDEMWNGERMSLIIDHINGKNDDCRLENLRIVCPNCNATLETHCRGYKGIGIKNKTTLV